MLWCDKLDTYLGHWRLGLFTSLLLCVSIAHEAETLSSCGISVWHGTGSCCRNAHLWLQEIWKDAGYLVVRCNNLDWCHCCEESAKNLLGRARQNGDGWIDWYMGDGAPLFATTALPLRVSVSFPWIPPSLAIPYLCTEYLTKALHSNLCTAEVWQSLLHWGEAWKGFSGCTIRPVYFPSCTRSSVLILIDNESSSFLPTEQRAFLQWASTAVLCVLAGGKCRAAGQVQFSHRAGVRHPLWRTLPLEPTPPQSILSERLCELHQHRQWAAKKSHELLTLGQKQHLLSIFLILNTAKSAVFQQLFY